MSLTKRIFVVGGLLGLARVAMRPEDEAKAAGSKFPLTRTDAEWRSMLTPAQYAVLRESATEPPYTSPLNDEHRRGNFACAGCDQEVFSSTTKFDSRTGWPSFWAALDNAIGTTRDMSLRVTRVAVHCSRCGGHLGHVFNDGPKPTGLRYCMNGIAMTFKPASA
jgi:peptide-methionine (R)-S-oxide reductase